jgi:hypothetical protein
VKSHASESIAGKQEFVIEALKNILLHQLGLLD